MDTQCPPRIGTLSLVISPTGNKLILTQFYSSNSPSVPSISNRIPIPRVPAVTSKTPVTGTPWVVSGSDSPGFSEGEALE